MDGLLDKLIGDEKVHYIYRVDDALFGGEETPPNFIIVAEDTDHLFELLSNAPFSYTTFTTKDWFDQILNGKLIGWVCACINKKWIYKEAVKLIMKFDDIVLRKEANLLFNKAAPGFDTLVDLRLILQILINHKIVNYSACKTFANAEDSAIKDEMERVYEEICNLTNIRYSEYLKAQQMSRLKKVQDE